MERMTAQSHNRFVFCVVVVELAVNGNQALNMVSIKPIGTLSKLTRRSTSKFLFRKTQGQVNSVGP